MIAIIEYKAGNTTSVQNAITRLGYKSVITANKDVLLNADKIILPGVGSAGMAMAELQRQGMDRIIKETTQPLLGICLGMQLLCSYSEEDNTDCLGIFDTKASKFPPGYIIPHTGWNNIYNNKGKLFQNIPPNADVYFVHSYYLALCKDTISSCRYIIPFSAGLQKNNFYATQFHPEKSGETGQLILRNFLSL